MVQIFNIDYNDHVEIIGTAHFTRRSINDAYKAIKSLGPRDVAIELDWGRYQQLNTACVNCSKSRVCSGLCEFTEAVEALGNVDANIWLIDMTAQEMEHRIKGRMTPSERANIGFQRYIKNDFDPIWLWERGFKDRVINNSKRQLETLRKYFPSVWRVLIDERNALMAARLAWIASKNLNEKKQSRVLTFVGAAHVEGIKQLLSNPLQIKANLRENYLSFTKPTIIRRVAIQNN
jgi:pheromone shutdown protein TraB